MHAVKVQTPRCPGAACKANRGCLAVQHQCHRLRGKDRFTAPVTAASGSSPLRDTATSPKPLRQPTSMPATQTSRCPQPGAWEGETQAAFLVNPDVEHAADIRRARRPAGTPKKQARVSFSPCRSPPGTTTRKQPPVLVLGRATRAKARSRLAAGPCPTYPSSNPTHEHGHAQRVPHAGRPSPADQGRQG